MGRSKAPGPADATKIADWNRRQSDSPNFGGQFSFTLTLGRVRSDINSGEISKALGALEILSVIHDHLRNGSLSLDSWNANAERSAHAGMPHISIPVKEVFLPIIGAYARYVSSGPGITLGATFIEGSTNQGAKAHSPAAIRKRQRDFEITLGVILFCFDRGERGEKTTLHKAFEHVAKQSGITQRFVAKVYRANVSEIRSYLERVGAPISFPD